MAFQIMFSGKDIRSPVIITVRGCRNTFLISDVSKGTGQAETGEGHWTEKNSGKDARGPVLIR
jgi:hypothetical protein